MYHWLHNCTECRTIICYITWIVIVIVLDSTRNVMVVAFPNLVNMIITNNKLLILWYHCSEYLCFSFKFYKGLCIIVWNLLYRIFMKHFRVQLYNMFATYIIVININVYIHTKSKTSGLGFGTCHWFCTSHAGVSRIFYINFRGGGVTLIVHVSP